MRQKIVLILLILFANASMAALDVQVMPRFWDSTSKDSVIVSFRLSVDMTTTVKFVNLYGGEEFSCENSKNRKSGMNKIIISTRFLQQLNSGVFYLQIEGSKAGKDVLFYNSFNEPWGEMVTATDVDFDRNSSEISYQLPKPSIVKLRLGLREGALVRTLLNWIPQSPGIKKIIWDGFDQSGQTEVSKTLTVFPQVLAFALPKTSLLIVNDKKPLGQSTSILYPSGWEEFSLFPLSAIPWNDSKDFPLNFSAKWKNDTTFTVSFPNQSTIPRSLLEKNSEMYITIGEYIIENANSNIKFPTEYSIACPHLRHGEQYLLINFIFENNIIASGIKKVIF